MKDQLPYALRFFYTQPGMFSSLIETYIDGKKFEAAVAVGL